MPRRQPYSTRGARAATTAFVLAAACLPDSVCATEVAVVRWLSATAAPALHAAAPTNDPVLAGRELLNRSLADGFAQLHRVGPPWLDRVRFDLSFDPAFQPRYTVAATQPVLASARHGAAVNLQGRVVYDKAGRAGGEVGLRCEGRWHDHDFALGLRGGVEERWLDAMQRYSVGADARLSALEVRANLYDDAPERPASAQIAERRLDGYDLELGAPLPFLPWARLRASRFWQLAVNGDTATIRDRVGLRLAPLTPLEIEAGTQTRAEARSWFTQLRWRMPLGG